MANYHKRNSIRAVQWDPENAQSFEDLKKLIAENPGIGWKADNIVRNDASDNIIIRSFGMIVLRIKPYEYLVEGKKDSLFTVPPETFELMYESDESRRFAKWEFGGFIVDSKTIYMASKPVKALLQSSDFIDDMDVFEKLDSIRIPLFRKNIPADPAMFQDKDTVDKAVRNACSAFLFGTRCNEFSNLIRTMYPLNDDDVIHYLSSPSDWAEETSSVITASSGTASRIYYMARLIAIDRMSELFLTFYEHDSADPKDITNVCKSMMDAVKPYKVVTLVMDYIDDKKMGEHLEVDCPSHLIRDADVLRRKGISVTRISAFAKPEATQRFVCKHPNLIKQVEKGTNMFDVFVFPIDCITRIRAGEKVLWTNPTT